MKSQIPELKTHFIFALPHSIRAESNRQLPLTYKMHSCQGDHWCLRKLPLPSLERNQFSLLPGCNIFSVNLHWVESKVKVWDYKFLLPEGIAQVFLLCIVSSLITAVTWGFFSPHLSNTNHILVDFSGHQNLSQIGTSTGNSKKQNSSSHIFSI